MCSDRASIYFIRKHIRVGMSQHNVHQNQRGWLICSAIKQIIKWFRHVDMKQPALSELHVAYFILNPVKSKNLLCITWHLQERQCSTKKLEMFAQDEVGILVRNYLSHVIYRHLINFILYLPSFVHFYG